MDAGRRRGGRHLAACAKDQKMRPFRPRGSATSPSLANINADTIRRAEEAVSKLASQYRDWVRGDLTKLRASLAAARGGGDARDGAYKDIRGMAHDLRGQGTTFGYPLITRIAQSISQSLKELPPDAETDRRLGAHVEAIAAVVEQDASGTDNAAATAIMAGLEAAIGRRVA
jgi:hypothetical protein